MSASFIASLAVLSYLASASLIGFRLFNPGQEHLPSRSLVLALGFIALLLHALLLVEESLAATGLNLGFFGAISLVAWTVVLLLLLSSLGKPVENLGLVLFPLAILSLGLDAYFPPTRLLHESASLGLKLHVLVSMLAYGLLSLASVQAVLLAVQDRHLHRRHPGGFIRALPPLQTMESLLFEMIAAGFLLLTLSLGSGLMFLEDMFAQHLAHKTILSITSWLVFGTLLWGRFQFGWRGRTAIAWTLSGVLVLMLAYFGSKAVLELILKRPPSQIL